MTPDGTRVLSAGRDGRVHTWLLDSDTQDLVPVGIRGWNGLGWVTSLLVSPDGSRLVSGSTDGVVRVWDLSGGLLLGELPSVGGWVSSAAAMTPDARYLVSGSTDGTVRVWDVGTLRLVTSLRGHTASVNDVAVMPDGVRAVSGSSDGTVRIWDISRARQIGAPL